MLNEMPTDTAREGVEIIQADREAAATYLRARSVVSCSEMVKIRDGEWDSVDHVQAFARHRLASLANRPADDGEDFLGQLRRVNTERYFAWVGDSEDAGIMFDALELGGEVGELLNVVKKLEREERGWRGSRADPANFADECADVLICLDKLARRRGVDLVAATVAKFNATSDKVGLPQHLALPPQPEGVKR